MPRALNGPVSGRSEVVITWQVRATGRLGPQFRVNPWHNRASKERGLGIDAGDDSVVALLLCPQAGVAWVALPHRARPRVGIMTV